MRKSQTTTINIFLLVLFYIAKFIFCKLIYWRFTFGNFVNLYLEKLSLYCYICITVFFVWKVIGSAVVKENFWCILYKPYIPYIYCKIDFQTKHILST